MMENILAIDIGNTNVTVGLFKRGQLDKKAKVPTNAYSLYEKKLAPFLKENGKTKIIISSVVPLALSRLLVHLNRIGKAKATIVGRDVKVPIHNLYKNKGDVGQDRLVNAFAANRLYGTPCVIIDFGTAITFDIVSRKGEYLGGLILPGIEMGLRALYQKTALLPKVELKPTRDIIGTDTVGSMRGGILFGYGVMCDGLVERYRKILGKRMKVIATGGNCRLIKQYTKAIQIADEDLTLKGLYLINHVQPRRLNVVRI